MQEMSKMKHSVEDLIQERESQKERRLIVNEHLQNSLKELENLIDPNNY